MYEGDNAEAYEGLNFVLWSVPAKRPIGLYAELEDAQERGFQEVAMDNSVWAGDDEYSSPSFWIEEEEGMWELSVGNRVRVRIYAL